MTSHGENPRGEFPPGQNGGGAFWQGRNPVAGFPPGANPSGKEATVPTASGGDGNGQRRRSVGGRPRKAAAERRTTKFTVAVNEAEKEAVEEAARAAGLAPSVYLREAALGTRMAKRESDVLFHRLSRIGVRLQRLVRQASDEGRGEERAELEALLQEVVGVRALL